MRLTDLNVGVCLKHKDPLYLIILWNQEITNKNTNFEDIKINSWLGFQINQNYKLSVAVIPIVFIKDRFIILINMTSSQISKYK